MLLSAEPVKAKSWRKKNGMAYKKEVNSKHSCNIGFPSSTCPSYQSAVLPLRISTNEPSFLHWSMPRRRSSALKWDRGIYTHTRYVLKKCERRLKKATKTAATTIAAVRRKRNDSRWCLVRSVVAFISQSC